MKIVCEQSSLSSAVTNVQRAVSTKTTLPALEGILIRAENGKIKLCGYDLEIGITTTIDAQIEKEGAIVVNAKLFGDIVRRLPNNVINIETDDKYITYISSGEVKYQIVGMYPGEFPDLPSFDEIDDITIQSQLLKNMIKQTIFATSDDLSKMVYTGALFEFENNVFRIVAIDGIKMAIRKEDVSYDKESRFIVPKKALNEILKLGSDDDEEEIRIITGQRHAIFKIKNYSIFTRLIEGTFIDYKKTIPPTVNTETCVVARDFINSVERMSLLTSEKIQSPIRLHFSESEISLSCSTTIGKANDSIKALVKGRELEIGFGNKHLLEALRNTDSDIIKIELFDGSTAMKITPTEGDSYLFLVVPMLLQRG